MTSSKRKRRPLCPAAVLLAATLLSTFFILHALPPAPTSARNRLLLHPVLHNKATMEPALGPHGELMLTFLRPDLPFTVFIPTPSSFESMLLGINRRFNTSGTLSPNSTVFEEEESNYAVISRIFGFSAVPRRILLGMVPFSGEISIDSVSGFGLNLARLPPKGTLMVNNLACNTVDIIKGSIVVHLVDGVLMDSDFGQSVIPFQDDLYDNDGMP